MPTTADRWRWRIASPLLALAGAASAAPTPPPAAAPLLSTMVLAPPAPSRNGRLSFVVENTGDKPLALQRVALLDIVRSQNGPAQLVETGEPIRASCPEPLVIPPGQQCRYQLNLSALSTPGRYEARVRVVGAQGGPQSVTLVTERRRSAWVALALIFVGALAGALVNWWRGGAAARTEDLITVRVAIDDIHSVLRGLDHLTPAAGPLLTLAERLAERIAREAYTQAEITELRMRAGLVRDVIGLRGSPDATSEALLALAPSSGPDLATPLNTAQIEILKQKVGASRLATESQLPPAGLPLDPRRPVAELRTFQSLAAIVVGALLLGIFVAVALHTSYASPTWGAPEDLLAALLIGFLGYAGTAAGVSALITSGKTKPF